MKRWIGLAAALYPREWRAEFGEEFRAEMLSRAELSSIINDPRLVLYHAEVQRMPLEDVIGRNSGTSRKPRRKIDQRICCPH